jgi:hypothetical protein
MNLQNIPKLDDYFKPYSIEKQSEIIQKKKEIETKPIEKEFEWEHIPISKWGFYGAIKPGKKYYINLSYKAKRELDKKKIEYENQDVSNQIYHKEIQCILDRQSIHYLQMILRRFGDILEGKFYRSGEEYLGSWQYSKEFAQLQTEIFLRGLRIPGFRKEESQIKFRGEIVLVRYIEKYLKEFHTIEQLITFNKILKELAKKKDKLLTFKQLYTDYINAEKRVHELKKEIKKVEKILVPAWRKSVPFL